MIVIIWDIYKENPSRTVDATERNRFSKSKLNDLENIGQGQRSSHVTHLCMLVIICTKYGENPSKTVDTSGRTRKVNRQTDRWTDRQTGWIQYTPPKFVARWMIITIMTTTTTTTLTNTSIIIGHPWDKPVTSLKALTKRHHPSGVLFDIFQINYVNTLPWILGWQWHQQQCYNLCRITRS